jgi:hypothetical protein
VKDVGGGGGGLNRRKRDKQRAGRFHIIRAIMEKVKWVRKREWREEEEEKKVVVCVV